MKVLLDHNIPVQLCSALSAHEVLTARELRWELLKNGDLLESAERAGFHTLVTADQSIFYQQNNSTRTIA